MINILVVDDSSTNTLLLSSALKAHNKFKVTNASSGEMALTLIKKNSFDIIVLDVMMPGMSGYEVLQQLKEDKSTSDIPVIILTAGNIEGDADTAIQLGASAYMEKPVDIDVLLKKIDKLL